MHFPKSQQARNNHKKGKSVWTGEHNHFTREIQRTEQICYEVMAWVGGCMGGGNQCNTCVWGWKRSSWAPHLLCYVTSVAMNILIATRFPRSTPTAWADHVQLNSCRMSSDCWMTACIVFFHRQSLTCSVAVQYKEREKKKFHDKIACIQCNVNIRSFQGR